jgi:hypothetical protein
MYRTIPVFVASPKDLQRERDLVLKAIEQLSPRLVRLFQIGLVEVDWSQFAPSAEPGERVGLEDLVLRSLDRTSLFVGLLYKRVGTAMKPGSEKTRTEAEFDYAIRNRNRVHMLTYFRNYGGSDQLQVERLKKRIARAGFPIQEYSTRAEFGERIALDLYEAFLSMILGSTAQRRRDLGRFFLFGRRRRYSTTSPVLNVYPPIHQPARAGQAASEPTADWRTRLVPNVVFEDFKAIQKVEWLLQTLSLTYKTVPTSHPLVRAEPGNRVWLCIPRNESARKELERLDDCVDFSFNVDQGPRATRSVRWLTWRAKDGTNLRVRSPLAKYLARQRPAGWSRWDPRYANIYARDYAVLARFRINDRSAVPGEPFYHYFLAGIRGLGTWGAGWFVERYPDLLAKHAADSPDGNVQLLLEVICQDYRIIDVRTVHDKGQAYFDERFSDAFIDAEVARHEGRKPFPRRRRKAP